MEMIWAAKCFPLERGCVWSDAILLRREKGVGIIKILRKSNKSIAYLIHRYS